MSIKLSDIKILSDDTTLLKEVEFKNPKCSAGVSFPKDCSIEDVNERLSLLLLYTKRIQNTVK